MEIKNIHSVNGHLRVSVGAIQKICKLAALEIEGVYAVVIGNTGVKGLFSKANIMPAIKVEIAHDVAVITMHISVTSTAKIATVCEAVQENVKIAVQNTVGITVSRVNIVVAGISKNIAIS